MMRGFWLFLTLLGPLFCIQPLKAQPLHLSLASGYSSLTQAPKSPIVISEAIQDTYHQNQQQTHPALLLGLEKDLTLHQAWLPALSLGAEFFYLNSAYQGQVWELNLPEFYNYNYQIKAENLNFMLTMGLHLPSPGYQIDPFLLAGLGVSLTNLHYQETALAGIDPASVLGLNPILNHKLGYELGLGLKKPLNEQFALMFRYHFLDAGTVHTNRADNLRSPIQWRLSSNNFLFGVQYLA